MWYMAAVGLKQALIRDKRHPELYLLPSAQTKDKTAVSPEQDDQADR